MELFGIWLRGSFRFPWGVPGRVHRAPATCPTASPPLLRPPPPANDIAREDDVDERLFVAFAVPCACWKATATTSAVDSCFQMNALDQSQRNPAPSYTTASAGLFGNGWRGRETHRLSTRWWAWPGHAGRKRALQHARPHLVELGARNFITQLRVA